MRTSRRTGAGSPSARPARPRGWKSGWPQRTGPTSSSSPGAPEPGRIRRGGRRTASRIAFDSRGEDGHWDISDDRRRRRAAAAPDAEPGRRQRAELVPGRALGLLLLRAERLTRHLADPGRGRGRGAGHAGRRRAGRARVDGRPHALLPEGVRAIAGRGAHAAGRDRAHGGRLCRRPDRLHGGRERTVLRRLQPQGAGAASPRRAQRARGDPGNAGGLVWRCPRRLPRREDRPLQQEGERAAATSC